MTKNLLVRAHTIRQKYELSFDPEKVSFELRIPTRCVQYMNLTPSFWERVRVSEMEFDYKKQWVPNRAHFGFKDCFQQFTDQRQQVTFLSAFLTKQNVIPIMLTFMHVFKFLQYEVDCEEAAKGEDDQLAYFDVQCSRIPSAYGGAFKLELSLNLSNWLAAQDESLRQQVNPVIDNAVQKAFERVTLVKADKAHTVGLTGRGFLMTLPTTPYTCEFGIERQHQEDYDGWMGYKTFCHNVDTPAQAIVLIAGFAALCDEYRTFQTA